jgi:predicted transcriptional regulator
LAPHAGSVRGIVTLQQVSKVAPTTHREVRVRDLMRPLEADLIVAVGDSVYSAFEKASRNGLGRLAVLNGPSLVGYVSLNDITHVLALSGARAAASGQPARRHAA